MISDSWASEELSLLTPLGLRRSLEPLTSPQGPEVVLRGEERLINFSSNDYLGLAADPELAAAAKLALDQFGTGSGASRLVVGDSAAHRLLERQLAQFEGASAALLFNSGYAANVGVISALCGPGDVVFSDALNHASIIDGCRLSRAKTVVYPHRDVAALAELLKHNPGRRRLVVTDAVFSMDGDRAPLRALEALCRESGAALMVDEAHATGVIGPTGAGLCEELGVSADLRMGTLSKALGGFGAWVACSTQVRELLFHRARSLVFSTSLPPMVCAAAAAAVSRVKNDPALRAKLWRNIRTFSDGLKALGHPSHEDSAIFPVVLGTPDAAVAASATLRAEGLLVKAIRPPTVPEGRSLIRFAISAAHTDAHLERALTALEHLRSPRSPAVATRITLRAPQCERLP